MNTMKLRQVPSWTYNFNSPSPVVAAASHRKSGCRASVVLAAMLLASVISQSAMAGPVNRFNRSKSSRSSSGCTMQPDAARACPSQVTPDRTGVQAPVPKGSPVNRFRPRGRRVFPATPTAFIAEWWQNIFPR